MRELLSLAEITVLEDADALGGSTLSAAAEALHGRWQRGIRDSETLLRLLFLLWYNCADQGFLSQAHSYPAAEDLIEEAGGAEALPPDSLFVLGLLADLFPYCFGSEDEWRQKSKVFLQRAAEQEPHSRLLRNGAYFVGKADDTRDPRIYIEPEVHARFSGRGELGRYMHHMLTTLLRPERAPAQPA